jgi:site-specific DNA recombinase
MEAVFVDTKKYETIVAMKVKPPFIPIFQVAASKKESGILRINELMETIFKITYMTKDK